MDNFCNNEVEFDNVELNSLIKDLQNCFKTQQNNFARTCFCINKICDYFDNNTISNEKKSNEYYDKYKLLSKFGFGRDSVSRLVNCYREFIDGTDMSHVHIKTLYAGFSPSKLFELLPLSYRTRENAIDNKFISPQMTVKEIRAYLKSLKANGGNAEKVVESHDSADFDENEIPMAYNPKKHYDIEYFDSMSKKQLVNAIWDLQKYAETLKFNIKSTGKKSTNKVA